MEDITDVIIIGAGAAGLAAAIELVEEELSVQIIEARPRLGGRICTHTSDNTSAKKNVDGRRDSTELPIELGAEFVHGAKKGLWPILHQAGLETEEVPDRHWQIDHGQWTENKCFWEQLEKIISEIDEHGPDRDFDSFLARTRSFSSDEKRMARLFIEGFHASHANRVSILAIAKSEGASEEEEGTRAFRVKRGYRGLVDCVGDRVKARGVAP